MIVRIAAEGQFRVTDEQVAGLNAVDEQLSAAVEASDEAQFAQQLEALITLAEQGEPVPVEELVASDVVLPARDTTLAEARQLIRGDGLIPG